MSDTQSSPGSSMLSYLTDNPFMVAAIIMAIVIVILIIVIATGSSEGLKIRDYAAGNYGIDSGDDEY